MYLLRSGSQHRVNNSIRQKDTRLSRKHSVKNTWVAIMNAADIRIDVTRRVSRRCNFEVEGRQVVAAGRLTASSPFLVARGKNPCDARQIICQRGPWLPKHRSASPRARILTRQQKSTDVGVARGKRIVDPSAANEETLGRVRLLRIRQRPEAVSPEPESIELRPDDPRIAHEPRGRAERNAHAEKRQQEHADADVAGQAALLHRRSAQLRRDNRRRPPAYAQRKQWVSCSPSTWTWSHGTNNNHTQAPVLLAERVALPSLTWHLTSNHAPVSLERVTPNVTVAQDRPHQRGNPAVPRATSMHAAPFSLSF